jgi:hypothetical protein
MRASVAHLAVFGAGDRGTVLTRALAGTSADALEGSQTKGLSSPVPPNSGCGQDAAASVSLTNSAKWHRTRPFGAGHRGWRRRTPSWLPRFHNRILTIRQSSAGENRRRSRPRPPCANSLTRAGLHGSDAQGTHSRHRSRRRNRQYPGHQDVARDAPPHSAKPSRCASAHNRA